MGKIFRKIETTMKVMVSKGITLLTSAAYLLGVVIGVVMQAWRRIRGGRD